MRRGLRRGLAQVLVAALVWGPGAAAQAGQVRPAVVAGSWYPGDAEELARYIDTQLEAAPQGEPQGRVRALIAPHAGYMFSGPTAAAAFRLVRGHVARRVIVLGPAHRGGFKGLSIAAVQAYESPLGRIPLDREAIARLRQSPLVGSYAPAHAKEHSIEMQLPFLQRALKPGWTLVPILVGEMDADDYARAGALLRPLAHADTLVVVSGDLTHYGPRYHYLPFSQDARIRERLARLDKGMLRFITDHDPEGLTRYQKQTGITACAFGPVMVLLGLMPPQAKVRLVKYTTSGALTHNYRNSVSYMAVAITDPGPLSSRAQGVPDVSDPQRLSEQDLALLHRFAVEGIGAAVRPRRDLGSRLRDLITRLPPRLKRPAGAFVTLKKQGRLRGCMGSVKAKQPLYRAVFENGFNAARNDYRFPPLRPGELRDLEVDISVLSPLHAIPSYRAFEVGKEGVLLKKDGKRAVFLPQVAAERGWSCEQTLTQLAQKAGLAPDAWRNGAELEVFTNQSYSAAYRGEGRP